ncbi:MAG: S1 RNA-binding domain-containing protein [Candidatus Cloacimonetes bacterium]|nr:S1 RNA-binding domain-containing protein [Candidatus Cloacimonadota bacterium]
MTDVKATTEQVKSNVADDYQKMLDQSLTQSSEPRKGDVVEGEIININDSYIFVNLGGKVDAIAAREDYQDKDGTLKVAIGDKLSGFIVDINESSITIARSLSKSNVDKSAIKDAFINKIPVEGKVTSKVKGGYSVSLLGVRAFCPVSQIDLRPSDNAELYVGKSFEFMIIEFEDRGRNIIVSRKAVLDAEISAGKDAVLSKLNPGDVVKGIVKRFTNFGAFIDLGGYEGLLHVSEISWAHVAKPEDVLAENQEIEVKILAMDNDKISLSLKQLEINPFEKALSDLNEGDDCEVKVLRLHPFGAFVEIKPGVEGLIPVSELAMGRMIKHPKDVLSVGDIVEARILKIIPSEQKISLSMKALQPDPWADVDSKIKEGDIVEGTVETNTKHGVFVTIAQGLTGLLPISRIREGEQYHTGDKVELAITRINVQDRRISLNYTDAPADEEKPRFKKDFSEQNNENHGNWDKKSRTPRRNDQSWKKFASEERDIPDDNPFKDL